MEAWVRALCERVSAPGLDTDIAVALTYLALVCVDRQHVLEEEPKHLREDALEHDAPRSAQRALRPEARGGTP